MTRRQIAGLIGIDEAVISRRLGKDEYGNPKQEPTREALIVINTLAEVFEMEPGKGEWNATGWLVEKMNQAASLRDLGRVA